MEEHENKDIEPDPAGAETGAPGDRQQGGLVADVAGGVMAGVEMVVLLVVVVEIGVVELLVVGFGGLSLLELLLLRLTGDPLHVTALGFRPLWRSIQQPCQWIRKVWWCAKGTGGFPREEIFQSCDCTGSPGPDSFPPVPWRLPFLDTSLPGIPDSFSGKLRREMAPVLFAPALLGPVRNWGPCCPLFKAPGFF